MDLTNDQNVWVVLRRYREIRACHKQLAELYGRSSDRLDELPAFPHKEPVMQQVFGFSSSRRAWADERRAQLRNYVAGVLKHPKASCHANFESLLRTPAAGDASGRCPADDAECFVQEGATGKSAKDAAAEPGALLTSMCVRLAGPAGELEVVIRAGEAGASRRVRLALRPLGEGKAASCKELWPEDALLPAWDLELSALGAWDCEARHRLALRPGSCWELSATALGDGDVVGNALSIGFRVPGKLPAQERDATTPTTDGSPEVSPHESLSSSADEEEEDKEILITNPAEEEEQASPSEKLFWQSQRTDGSWAPAPFDLPTSGIAPGEMRELEFRGVLCVVEFTSETEGTVSAGDDFTRLRLVTSGTEEQDPLQYFDDLEQRPFWQSQRTDGSWAPAPFELPTSGIIPGQRSELEFRGVLCVVEFTSETEGIVSAGDDFSRLRLVTPEAQAFDEELAQHLASHVDNEHF